MSELELLQTLLAHDRWATVQVLDSCTRLSDDAFHRRFDIGAGSLHDTLTHVVAAARAWGETLSGAEPRPRLDTDGQRRTPEQLRKLLDEVWRELAAQTSRPLQEMVTRRLRDGRSIQLARATVFAQIATHGAHHRAQCLNMLRQLGVQPAPGVGVVDWMWASEKTGSR